MINGTKLLNVAGMTRGRRDGILKSEKVRHVVKIGPMHLKGVWYVIVCRTLGHVETNGQELRRKLMTGFRTSERLISPTRKRLRKCFTHSSYTISVLCSITQQTRPVPARSWPLLSAVSRSRAKFGHPLRPLVCPLFSINKWLYRDRNRPFPPIAA
jgi:protein SOK2